MKLAHTREATVKASFRDAAGALKYQVNGKSPVRSC